MGDYDEAAGDGEAKCQVSIDLDTDAGDDLCNGGDTLAAVVPPEPPALPSFLANVRVEEITPEIQRRLALALDLPSPSPSLKNWEWLASALGMPAEEITYIRERARYPDSPTLIVLRRYGGESFSRVLHIIRDSLLRYDVIIQLIPVLLAFEEHLGSTKTKQGACAGVASNVSQSLPTVDSGIVGTSQATGASGTISHSAAAQSNGRQLILITFAEETPQHRKLVLWLCKNLENAEFHVVLDNALLNDDWMTTAYDSFKKARAIVVICSPAYLRCVDASPQAAVPEVMDTHGQCTRFIYQQMCVEYRENGCKNCRFRPVIFDAIAGNTELVPPFLRNTVIHRWPKQHNDFMRFLLTG